MAPFCEYDGLFLPLFGKWESEWHNDLRRTLYILGLVWCFVGIGVISDVFMAAIEKITSKKTRVKNKKTGRLVTVTVWNETVSNLTLMALGSSAPEIMLSLIEIMFVKNMYIGDLGPSTIIGSAAFNLLCISAVCVSAIPSGQVRFIKETSVYAITASFSLFAYVWLIFILSVWTPDVVTIIEGLLTLIFFPLLIIIAYLADIGYFKSLDPERDELHPSHIIASEVTADEIAQLERKIRQEHGMELSDELVRKIMEAQYFYKRTRAFYRHAAISAATGTGKKLSSAVSPSANLFSVSTDCRTRDAVDEEYEARALTVGFSAARFAVLENCGHAKIPIKLSQPADRTVTVKYKTKEGTAKEHDDFEPLDGVAEFAPGEVEKIVAIQIVDDVAYEDEEEFYLELTDPQFADSEDGEPEPEVTNVPANTLSPEPRASTSTLRGTKVKLGELSVATVLIIDDDEPGSLRFSEEQLIVSERAEDHVEHIVVERKDGASGVVGCKFHTEPNTAVPGHDYIETEGDIKFEHGQLTAEIEVTIKAVGRFDLTEEFRVIITDPTGGARFDKNTDGGENSCILTVIIKANDDAKPRITKMMSAMRVAHKKDLGHKAWRKQFQDAIFISADDDEDGGGGDPGPFDYFMHVVALPWKLLFAVVPPTEYCDGWACFFSSLMMIGFVTAVVSDMASLVGCTLGIKDEITAITFVALGTSLPDTFASQTAAKMDPFADASIGNVTGSNSVNVFLGLGLPWTIAAIYWACKGDVSEWHEKFLPAGAIGPAGNVMSEEGRFYAVRHVAKEYPDGVFVVPAGTLWFNLLIFSLCALSAIALLALRRVLFAGELGGPALSKHGSSAFLFGLWLFYLVMSTWWCYKDD
mmetsp:Transcript_112244/g.194568  ORF Transcript_112244/g.194568 Transcript_112244/m.194568 type:complete len:868 (+) Transcript_112244:125-2728(+)